MTTEHLSEYPSLDEVRHELDLQLAEQERRAANFDTKAGLLLGFGGVLIGIAPRDLTVLHIIAQAFAAGTVAMAVWAIFPRISANLDLRELRNKYLSIDAPTTRLRLLDTRIWLYEQDNTRLTAKVTRMRITVALLVTAVVFLLAGSILEVATDGGDDGRDRTTSQATHRT